MDFRLTDEQTMLAETVGGLLHDCCTGADLRRLLESGKARDEARWSQIEAMGLPLMLAPETRGGSGLGPVEMALVAVACGHAALPEPLVEHAGIAVPVLVAAGCDLPDGTVAVGHPVNPFVADADSAAALLLADGEAMHLVARDAVTLVRQDSLDPFRRLFRVEWKPSAATRIAGAALWDAALERGALLAAAQLLGLAQRAVDIAVAYVADRQQFGKPIGSFQAVKHHLANAQVKIEFARPVVHAAAALMAAVPGAALAPARVSHAKLAAAAAADAAAHAAVQVHGAMGYSWEVDVHFVLKRALALTQAWGTPGFHRARVAHHMLAAPLGPDRTFDAALPESAGMSQGEARSEAA